MSNPKYIQSLVWQAINNYNLRGIRERLQEFPGEFLLFTKDVLEGEMLLEMRGETIGKIMDAFLLHDIPATHKDISDRTRFTGNPGSLQREIAALFLAYKIRDILDKEELEKKEYKGM